MEVASGGSVFKTNDVTVLEETDGGIQVELGFIPAGRYDPVVVLILIVIASDLLLI